MKFSKLLAAIYGIGLLSFCSQSSFADVKLPRLISDGMILQRDKPLKIWGWADPGENISISFRGKDYTTKTSADKKWRVIISPQKEGGPYAMKIKANNTVTISDILIGDIWLCSGQSNMGYLMERSKDVYPDEIAASKNPNIRQFAVKAGYRFDEADDTQSDGWISADPSTVLKFTAVGYFFAKELYDQYKVPIGIINSSIGGTPAEAWISEDGLNALPSYLKTYHFYQQPENLKKALGDSAPKTVQEKRAAAFKANHVPAVLYNNMIAPLTNYSVKGVLWYQGEANTGDPLAYRQLFPALIHDWRTKFSEPNLPFLYMQLANYNKPSDAPSESNVAVLRESQAMALKLPNTGMAVIHDTGNDNNIHPLNKKTVGHRAALLARNLVYGEKNIVYSGPVYQSMKTDGNKIILTFNNTGGGLVAKDGGKLKYFSIAGADKKFVWADARIDGDKIIVWSDKVANPVAVRYAWASNPIGANLYNKEGLPASLFRTDNWTTANVPDNDQQ